ncbi:MAG: hypothetical protein AB1411_11925 [Nitrospirota bacterium]
MGQFDARHGRAPGPVTQGTKMSAEQGLLKVASGAVLLGSLLWLGGCVSLDVQPLTKDRYQPRPGDAKVEVLKKSPSRAHVKLARLVATGEHVDEDRLQAKILSEARSLGADAIVVEKVDLLNIMEYNVATLKMYMSATAIRYVEGNEKPKP